MSQKIDTSGLVRLGEELSPEVLEMLRGLPDQSLEELGPALEKWLRARLAAELQRLAAEFAE